MISSLLISFLLLMKFLIMSLISYLGFVWNYILYNTQKSSKIGG